MIFDSCIWIGLAAGQVTPRAVIVAAGEAPVFNVKEATRKANESLTGSGHDDELA